nr:hypothetical protein [uncultured bacterium]
MYIPIRLQCEFLSLDAPTEPLDVSCLTRPMRHTDLKAFFRSLLDVRRAALYFNDCTGLPKSPALGSAHSLVASLMDSLESDWKTAFEAHVAEIQKEYAALLRGAGRSGKHGSGAILAPPIPSPKTARVAVAMSTASQDLLNDTIKLDKTIRHSLLSEIGCMPTAISQQSPLAILASRGMLSYCRATDFGTAFPDRLKTGPSTGCIYVDHELFDSYFGHLLITGPAGFGKTSFCRWNVLRDSDRLVTDQADVLPVYVPLYTLAHRAIGGVDDAFFVSSDLRTLVKDPKRSTHIRLYLDGLDEVPDVTRRAEIMNLARYATEITPRLQVIATARDHVRAAWLDWLPRVVVMPLRREQQERLVKNWLVEEADVKAFFDELATCEPLQPLMAVPLLGTLIAAVYKKRRNLPSNRSSLYGLFIELLCGGWDTIKGINRGGTFGAHDKQLILTRLAGLNHMGERREASIAEFRTAIKDSLAALSEFWPDLLEEVIEDGLLTKAGEILLFNHLSFQEYLAAVDLSEPTGERSIQALRQYLKGNDWWREVMLFYVALSHGLTTWSLGWLGRRKTYLQSCLLQLRNRWTRACCFSERDFGDLTPTTNPECKQRTQYGNELSIHQMAELTYEMRFAALRVLKRTWRSMTKTKQASGRTVNSICPPCQYD